MTSKVVLCFLFCFAEVRAFTPRTFDYADLTDSQRFQSCQVRSQLDTALSTDGIIQVLGIPRFASLRDDVLRDAHSCIEVSPNAQKVILPDSTVRRTLAAAAGVDKTQGEIDHGSTSKACQSFQRSSRLFRETLGGMADAFARRLDDLLDQEGASPILERQTGATYDTVEQIVRAGERLEHFHTYEVHEGGAPGPTSNTLDFHVDQGLFIAFSPAVMMSGAEPMATSSGAFLLKTADGEELEAELHQDALIFLLGDGANQIINARRRNAPFQAPSHAFRMPPCCAGLHRVWYGMMQLPPADALAEETGLTFGEIREQVMRAVGSSGESAQAAMSLGCSRKLQARELSVTCTDTQIYCWHRCYNFTETESPTACAARNSGFNCTNQFDQIYIGGHGDFTPACTNSTELYSPRPPVVQPATQCSGFQSLVSDAAFAHRVELDPDTTYFLWNVVDGQLHGKMLHNGALGWMAIGLESVGGSHNGMNGAHIVMMKNDPVAGSSIEEYNIHPTMSAHRHWKEPLRPSSLTETAAEVTGCHSSMTFKTSSFYNEPLNLTSGNGLNRMIWALTHLDYPTQDYGGYAGYHSAANGDRALRTKYRGKVELDLPNGLSVGPAPAVEPEMSVALTALPPACMLPALLAAVFLL